jgi:hypothetical protein
LIESPAAFAVGIGVLIRCFAGSIPSPALPKPGEDGSPLPLIHQQFEHILGPIPGGRLPEKLSWCPTEKDDISFFTLPWHKGHLTLLLWLATSLSNL